MIHPKMSTVFLLEDAVNWKASPGMKLYHTGTAKFKKFYDRPTWFTPDVDQAKGYKQNAVSGGQPAWVYTCKLKPGKVASEEDVAPFAKEVFGEENVIYSMFDELIGEWNKEDVRKFVKLVEAAGYIGCEHLDYDSTDNQKDSKTLVLFHPNSSVDILDVQEAKPGG